MIDIVLKTEAKHRSNVKTDALRWNPTSKRFEYWDGTQWVDAALSIVKTAVVFDGVVSLPQNTNTRITLTPPSDRIAPLFYVLAHAWPHTTWTNANVTIVTQNPATNGLQLLSASVTQNYTIRILEVYI